MSATLLHDHSSVAQIMRCVVLALLPAVVVYALLITPAIIVQCLIAVTAALLFEAMALLLQGKLSRHTLFDCSAVVTGLLFALSITPLAPWYVTLSGIAFAILIVKHCYGGIGKNIFNPAMAGYLFCLVSFPKSMTHWPRMDMVQSWLDTAKYIFVVLPAAELDAVTGATPLTKLSADLHAKMMLSEVDQEVIFGFVGSSHGEWVALAVLVGGIGLLATRIIHWKIPLATMLGIFLPGLILYGMDADHYVVPWFYLFSGGSMLAAFFIATDPVTSATTPRGQLLFGFGVGLIIFFVRSFGKYPDGVCFAVIIMNAAVPLIDRYTRPRILGG